MRTWNNTFLGSLPRKNIQIRRTFLLWLTWFFWLNAVIFSIVSEKNVKMKKTYLFHSYWKTRLLPLDIHLNEHIPLGHSIHSFLSDVLAFHVHRNRIPHFGPFNWTYSCTTEFVASCFQGRKLFWKKNILTELHDGEFFCCFQFSSRKVLSTPLWFIGSSVLFLQNRSSPADVELKVLLPDRNIISVVVKRTDTTDQVYEVSESSIGTTIQLWTHFSFFVAC